MALEGRLVKVAVSAELHWYAVEGPWKGEEEEQNLQYRGKGRRDTENNAVLMDNIHSHNPLLLCCNSLNLQAVLLPVAQLPFIARSLEVPRQICLNIYGPPPPPMVHSLQMCNSLAQ